jgi:hypothetical protein
MYYDLYGILFMPVRRNLMHMASSYLEKFGPKYDPNFGAFELQRRCDMTNSSIAFLKIANIFSRQNLKRGFWRQI